MPKPFRLTAPKPLESALQAQILDYLALEQAKGRVVWYARINGGLARYGKWVVKNYTLHLPRRDARSKGYSDLHGMLAGGRYFALEVKQPGENPTAEQAHFLEAVREGGGIAAVVFNFADAKNVLFTERESDE